MLIKTSCGTYEYQGRLQVLIVFLRGDLVVLYRHFMEVLEELSSMILYSGRCALFFAASHPQPDSGRARKNLVSMRSEMSRGLTSSPKFRLDLPWWVVSARFTEEETKGCGGMQGCKGGLTRVPESPHVSCTAPAETELATE